MYSIGMASELIGVCIKTLRRWDKKKQIRCVRTPGGHRRFPVQEIQKLLAGKEVHSKVKAPPANKCALYGRVSSHKQNKRGDLERQIDVMKAHVKDENMEIYRVYKDVGSGLNTNRRGLWRLLRDAKANKFSTIFINYKDRLTRFGYKYLNTYLSEFGVNLSCLNKLSDKSPESEMVEDLVAIIHSFSGKLYGLRSAKNRKKDKKKSTVSKNQ
jgi:excisionase family DNA binding protein